MRAVAIAGVVLQHLGASWFGGGYLGVDVFFVVSGFLITSHLFRDASAGRLSLPRFWARRVRRLMPASLVVLAVTAGAIVHWTPQYLWRQFLTEILASTTYLQNWLLISTGSDYFTESDPASPVRHFWSLSLEEQFYLVWPVLVLAVFAIQRRRGRPHAASALGATLLVLALASFASAVLATPSTPIFTFYATSTRIWEFALGGLIMLAPHVARDRGLTLPSPPPALVSALLWTSWVALAAALILLSPTDSHPGVATLWPTTATAVIIAAGSTGTTGTTGVLSRLVSLAPVQALGTLSYSLYLWHWPIIVISSYAYPGASATTLGIAQTFTSVVAAWVSYVALERTTQRASADRWFRPPLAFGGLAVGMALVAGATLPGWLGLASQDESSTAEIAERVTTDVCFGARSALNPEKCSTAPDDVVPSPASAWGDHPELMVDGGCYAARDTPAFGVCHVDESQGQGLRVLLVGDSHARDLSPTFASIARTRHWDLSMTARSACGFIFAEYGSKRRTAAENEYCYAWRDKVSDLITTGNFDAVILIGQQGVTWAGATTDERMSTGVAGASAAFDLVLASGAHVVTVQDTPLPMTGVFDCVEQYGSQAGERCTQPVDDAYKTDTLALAASTYSPDQVTLVPTQDLYCDDTACSPVVGGVFVYADQAGHLNSVWATSLADVLVTRLPALVTSP